MRKPSFHACFLESMDETYRYVGGWNISTYKEDEDLTTLSQAGRLLVEGKNCLSRSRQRQRQQVLLHHLNRFKNEGTAFPYFYSFHRRSNPRATTAN